MFSFTAVGCGKDTREKKGEKRAQTIVAVYKQPHQTGPPGGCSLPPGSDAGAWGWRRRWTPWVEPGWDLCGLYGSPGESSLRAVFLPSSSLPRQGGVVQGGHHGPVPLVPGARAPPDTQSLTAPPRGCCTFSVLGRFGGSRAVCGLGAPRAPLWDSLGWG